MSSDLSKVAHAVEEVADIGQKAATQAGKDSAVGVLQRANRRHGITETRTARIEALQASTYGAPVSADDLGLHPDNKAAFALGKLSGWGRAAGNVVKHAPVVGYGFDGLEVFGDTAQATNVTDAVGKFAGSVTSFVLSTGGSLLLGAGTAALAAGLVATAPAWVPLAVGATLATAASIAYDYEYEGDGGSRSSPSDAVKGYVGSAVTNTLNDYFN